MLGEMGWKRKMHIHSHETHVSRKMKAIYSCGMALLLLLGAATAALADDFGSYGKGRVVAASVKVRCSPSDIMTVKQELREHIYAVTCADKTTVIVRCTPQMGCKAGC